MGALLRGSGAAEQWAPAGLFHQAGAGSTVRAMTAVPRLFVTAPLGPGASVDLTRDQANYLFAVMRLSPGDTVLLFNGRDSEWSSTVAEGSKRGGRLSCSHATKPLLVPPDLWLVFCPIRKARTDFIVEKAAELGARRILPVRSQRTNAERLRQDRLQAHAIEAAEQCGGTFVPDVADMQPLARLLADWPEDRTLIFADETLVTEPTDDWAAIAPPAAILIGPEGGFTDEERERIRALPQAHAVSLGPRILRADTAAVSALTLWQSSAGDWR